MSKVSLGLFAALVFLIAVPTASQASCEVCKSYGSLGSNQTCFPAVNEVGVTQCQVSSDPLGWPPAVWCTEAGTFCSTIVVNGGGGGGGGTGGGIGCQGGVGGCPAECFSCGGGRPRI